MHVSQPDPAFLSCHSLDIAVETCTLVSQLNLNLRAGSITAVLGRNGAGKSLTLHTLAGLRPYHTGAIRLQSHLLSEYKRRDIARLLSFVPQDFEEPFPVSALECAVSGRHPHIDFWQWESPQDYDLARAALAAVDLEAFAERSVATLSGGERRRLAIATALTQAPKIFILDEPTNHLDPQHQLQVLKLLRRKADDGCAVIMSLHDPNLALRFADDALLLFGNGQWLTGGCSNTINADTLTRLYETPIRKISQSHEAHYLSI